MEHVALGIKTYKALSITGLTPHQYYYRSKRGHAGQKPSTTVLRLDSDQMNRVANSEAVQKMRHIQSHDDLRCGHRRMTSQLQLEGFVINHKKVYRLMKKHDLLFAKHEKAAKVYAKYRILMPVCPLSHLEMDIKFVWVEQYRSHALILSIMDVFTRRILEWHVGMSIKQQTVKEVFTRVVINHLQESDMLSKDIHIEIRNDNDKRFSAKMVQEFFKANYLNQVFTHPYTPQENGHIESFHNTLSKALKGDHFDTLPQLENRLAIFYDNYNNQRAHGSLCGLTPYLFHQEWEKGNIERIVIDENKRKVKFKLLVPKYHLSGNGYLREASCSNLDPLNGVKNLNIKKVNGAITTQPSVQRSPSVASC